MKKLGLLLAIFCSLQANGQPFTISFSGTALSIVKVQNLTTGVIVDVPAGDVLHLSTTTDIQEDMELKSPGLNVYPNPMTDKSTLTILTPISGDVIITISDLTGRVLTRFKDYLDNCAQEFSLSDIKNGLYIVNVQGSGYNYSTKILSNGRSNSTSVIARKNNSSKKVTSKKTINDSKGFQNSVDMIYNAGERLKFTAVSGNNSTVMTDIPSTDKTINFTFTECKDGDNNYYPVVDIGGQIWMAENLKTTKYKNGIDNIILKTDNTIWSNSTAGYCWYNNEEATYKNTYGALYNWAAVNTGNLCPIGWHVPTEQNWATLQDYLIANGYNYDGTTVVNKLAKSLGSTSLWTSSSTIGAVGNTDYSAQRNSTGFTALPGGCRISGGTFQEFGIVGYWWSSNERDAINGWMHYIIYISKDFVLNYSSKKSGYSIRCLKDN